MSLGKFTKRSTSDLRALPLPFTPSWRGEIGRGMLIGPAVERVLVSELLADLETEYRIQSRPSLRTLQGQVAALAPLVGHLRAIDVTTAMLRRVGP